MEVILLFYQLHLSHLLPQGKTWIAGKNNKGDNDEDDEYDVDDDNHDDDIDCFNSINLIRLI